MRKEPTTMAALNNSKVQPTVPSKYFWILLALWTVLVGSVLLWSLYHQKYEIEETARIQARSVFEKDLIYRRWAAGHGGVYVPVTENTPPNPHLSHIAERDITTHSGRNLTLMNPAYMTRQVHEMGKEDYGLRGHITSLNPINPVNAADEWETKALHAFEQGAAEVTSVEKLDNISYMRLMSPMITEQACLKCHSEQGYKVGDLRGGISVSVPMAPIQAIAREHALTLSLGHFILWLLGVGGISFGGQRLKQHIQELKKAHEAMQISEANYHAIFDSANDAIFVHDIKNGKILSVNQKACEIYGYTQEELENLTVEDISIGTPPYDQEHALERIEKAVKEGPQLFEWICKDKNGRSFWVEVNLKLTVIQNEERILAIVRDISERKKTEVELKRQRYYLAKAQEIGSIGTWDLDIKRNKLVWTDENYRIFGIPAGRELTYELFLNCVHPDDRQYVNEKWKEALNNKPYDIEHRLLVDGRVKWVREKAEVEFDENGNCIRGIGFTQDITERREVQEEREKLLHDMGERVKELTCMYSVAKAIRQRNTLENIFQDVTKLIPRGWHYPEITRAKVCFDGSEYVSDSFKETRWKQVSDLVVNEERRGSVEVYYLEEKPELDEGPFLKEERNLIDGIARALSEAIKSKSAEEQIKNLARFPSENPNPVLRVAKNGVLLYANNSSGSFLAKWDCSVGEVVPEYWRQTVSEVFSTGSSKRLEIEHAGRTFSFMIVPILDTGYANLYARDITERKQAENELQKANDELETRVQDRTKELAKMVEILRNEIAERKRLEKEVLEISEEEQRRIGRELHDGLQQELVGMTFECQLLDKKLTEKSLPEADYATRMRKLLNDAIDHTRDITRMLYPIDLDSKDMSFALEQLAARVESLFRISCQFTCKKSLVVKRSEVAINIYRIVQEAVTNAIKHGKADHISISLDVDENRITLAIKDNGVGLAADYAEDKGMGLRIMKYRASMIGASLNIRAGTKGSGTLVTCSFESREDKL
jgi:PAS domain S-box-containing protein